MLKQALFPTLPEQKCAGACFDYKATIFALCFSWYLDLRLKFFGCRETADFLFYVTLQRKKDCIIPTL